MNCRFFDSVGTKIETLSIKLVQKQLNSRTALTHLGFALEIPGEIFGKQKSEAI